MNPLGEEKALFISPLSLLYVAPMRVSCSEGVGGGGVDEEKRTVLTHSVLNLRLSENVM